MSKAVIVIILVCAFIVGTLVSIRRSARTGMPSQDTLDRATRRARELDARENAEKNDRGG